MTTRKKGAAGAASAAAPKADAPAALATVGAASAGGEALAQAAAAALGDGVIEGVAGAVQAPQNPSAMPGAIVLPAEGATSEDNAAIAAAVMFAQQPGQIASVLAAPVLDTGAQEGGMLSETGLMPDGYPEDIELGGRTVMVQSRSARGRWRIGRHFTTEPSPVLIDELTEDEVGRLLADPELIVSLDD